MTLLSIRHLVAQWSAGRARIPKGRAFTIFAITAMLGASLLVSTDASHSQSVGANTVRFTQVGGNEWWVQVRILGPTASSVLGKDTGGDWVALQPQTWTSDRTWWAASFRVETGNQVMFSASFAGTASPLESCWFDHPSGVERC